MYLLLGATIYSLTFYELVTIHINTTLRIHVKCAGSRRPRVYVDLKELAPTQYIESH